MALETLQTLKEKNELLKDKFYTDHSQLILPGKSDDELDPQFKSFMNALIAGAKQAKSDEEYHWIKEAAIYWESALAALGKVIKISIPESVESHVTARDGQVSRSDYKSAVDRQAYYISQDRRRALVTQLQELINKEGVEVLIGNPGLIYQMIGDENEQTKNDFNLANQMLILKSLQGKIDFSRQIPPDAYHFLESTWLSDVVKLAAYFRWKDGGEQVSPSHHLDDYYLSWETMCSYIKRPRKGSMTLFGRVADYIGKYTSYSEHESGRSDRHTLISTKAYRVAQFAPENSSDDNWREAEAYVNEFYSNIIPAVKDKNNRRAVMGVLNAMRALDNKNCRNEMINCFEMNIAVWYLGGD